MSLKALHAIAPARYLARCRQTPIPQLSRHSQRRLVSAYGYEQAKALIYSDNGEPKDVLHLHSHSISPAHSNLVTARLLAAPINPADINTIQGVYPSKPPFTTDLSTAKPSAVPGNEGLAEVISAGSSASTSPDAPALRKGDWLIMRGPGAGTWRTHIQAPAGTFLLLSEEDRKGITPVQAATVSVNPCTAYAMLKGWLGGGSHAPDPASQLKEGDWFIQNGANSGVGRAAIQLGRSWGLRSVNVIRSRPDADGQSGAEQTEKLKNELRELGADIVVTEEEAGEKSFFGLLKSAGASPKLAMNCVGGRSALNLAKVLASGSAHVTYGAMAKQPMSLPAGMLIFKDLKFAGFWVSRWSEVNPDEKMKAVKEVLGLTRAGKFMDVPVQELKWNWDTEEQLLKDAVQGTLEGFRGGKGVFVFGDS